jgi:hypothetical protein
MTAEHLTPPLVITVIAGHASERRQRPYMPYRAARNSTTVINGRFTTQ